MSDSKYTEKEINWAINEIKKKHPEKATREQAISYLDTLSKLGGVYINEIEKGKKSGKLKLAKLKN